MLIPAVQTMVRLVSRYLEMVRTGRLEAPALKRMVLSVKRKHKSNALARYVLHAPPQCMCVAGNVSWV